ncbi:hypothetical protein D3C80_947400 [compost metagenome]
MLVLVFLQGKAQASIVIQIKAEPGVQVMALGVHVAALKSFLGDAITIAVELIVALQQVGRQVPVEGFLTPGHALEDIVGKAFAIEIVGAADAHATAQCQGLSFVAFGDDVDDPPGSAGTVKAAGA